MAKQLALLLCTIIVLVSKLALCQNNDTDAFLSGHKIQFSTKGHPKAKGLNISVEYPSHWRSEEGERPNVVQKFIGDASDGFGRICIIMIKEQPDIVKLFSTQELSELIFSPETLKDIIPPGAEFLKGETTKYDAQPGAWVIYVMKAERAGFNTETYTLQQMCIYSGKLIILQCGIAGFAGNNEQVKKLFSEYLQLFQLMGNSLIIHDKWKKNDEGEYGILTWIFSAILTWGIGLTPPLLIRFLFLKRPLSKGWALGVIVLLWFTNLVIFTAIGSTSKTHGALLLVVWASYAILRKGAAKQEKKKKQPENRTPSAKSKFIQEEFTDIETYKEIDESLMGEKDKARVYAAVLGLHGSVTKQEIIDAYKRLIAKYHPDKVSHLGEEFQRYAEKKTKDINKAFYYLKRKYNL